MTQREIKPQENESLDGFLRRSADIDFWGDVSDFLGQAGLRYGHRMIEDLASAEQNLGIEPGSLAPISPRWKSKTALLNWRFERHHSAPVCPACIAEGRPHQQAWRHSLVTACTVHGLVLKDQCPMCCETFLPGKGGYDTCGCGCSLLYLEQDAATEADTVLSALVCGEMHTMRACLPPSLAFRAPSDIGEFLFFLAASGRMTNSGKHGKTTMPKTIEEARAFLTAAARVLCDWPAVFQQDASERLQRGDPSASTAPERLGRWYQRLMRFSNEAYDDFRTELGTVISLEFDGAYTGAAGLGSDSDREWMSAAEAARVIGIRPDRIVDAVASEVIDGKLYSRGFGHRHTAIRRTTVDTIRANRTRFVDKSAFREFLGVSRKQYELLWDAGFLASVVATNVPPLVDAAHDLDAARTLLDRIGRSAIRLDGSKVSLKDINLRFTTDRSGVLAVIRAIHDGRLSPALGSTSGKLAAFQFDRTEIDAILQRTLRGPGLTIQEVGRMTGWKDQCIAHWCDLGLLEHETYLHGPGKGRVIGHECLARFQARFVPLASLAKGVGTSSRKLMRVLAERGVETVGAMQEGAAWRGHLVPIAELASASLHSACRSSSKGAVI